MKNYKTDGLDVKKLTTLYESKQPIDDICKHFGISKQTLYNILKRENVELRRDKYALRKVCPLFDRTSYHNIYCEGVCDEFKMISVSFKDKNEKHSYIDKYCNGKGYQKCRIYRICQEFYERYE